MKWFAGAAAAVAALAAGLYAYSFALPGAMSARESIIIERPPSTVFAMLNNLQTFNEFSPWVEKDPNAVYDFVGFEPGVGQSMSWQGDLSVGSGTMSIIRSEPARKVELELRYEGVPPASMSYELLPAGPGTEVAWSYQAPLASARDRLSAHLFGGQSSVRRDLAHGLSRLSALCEEIPAVDFSSADIRLVQQDPHWLAFRDMLDAE